MHCTGGVFARRESSAPAAAGALVRDALSAQIMLVVVILDAGEIKDLPQEDIRMILRGADELISTGGRSMLAKILKGSKDKKIFEYKLNECPAYGYYQDMKLDDIS